MIYFVDKNGCGPDIHREPSGNSTGLYPQVKEQETVLELHASF